jgi:hypothetical protein
MLRKTKDSPFPLLMADQWLLREDRLLLVVFPFEYELEQ